jgi:hypothetical protein
MIENMVKIMTMYNFACASSKGSIKLNRRRATEIRRGNRCAGLRWCGEMTIGKNRGLSSSGDHNIVSKARGVIRAGNHAPISLARILAMSSDDTLQFSHLHALRPDSSILFQKLANRPRPGCQIPDRPLQPQLSHAPKQDCPAASRQ